MQAPSSPTDPSTPNQRIRPTSTNSASDKGPLTLEETRRRQRVLNETKRVRQFRYKLEALRLEHATVQRVRDQELLQQCLRYDETTHHAGHATSDQLERYLQLIDEADRLHAANLALTLELERRQLCSAAIDMTVANMEHDPCMTVQEPASVETSAVFLAQPRSDASAKRW